MFETFAAADYLRARQRPEFVDGLADLLADINALHPFREDNGRTQRAFLTQVARAAGHHIRHRAHRVGVAREGWAEPAGGLAQRWLALTLDEHRAATCCAEGEHLYFTMSQWGPYDVRLMRTRLAF